MFLLHQLFLPLPLDNFLLLYFRQFHLLLQLLVLDLLMLSKAFLQLIVIPSQVDLILPLLVPLHVGKLAIQLDLLELPLDLVLAIPEQHRLQAFALLH